MKQLKYLFAVPHPDDLELSCGILVQKLVAAGHTIKVVIVSTGVPFSRDKTEREAEAVAASTLLGVDDISFLRHASFALPENRWEIKQDMERIIQEFNPDMLFIPWEHDVHEDHAELAKICLVAGRSARTTYFYPAISAKNFEPDTVVLGTAAMLEQKVRAIALHKSQVDSGRVDPQRAVTASNYWLDNFGHHSRSRVNSVDKAASCAEVFKLHRQELDL